MTPWDHQVEEAELGYKILQENAILYLAWEERTGKSLTSLLIAEKANVVKILIITKKKPYHDWIKLLEQFPHNKYYVVTTYHQIHKLDSYDWDLIILDEAHNYITAFPTPSKIWKEVKKFTSNKPLIYLSATPNAQTYAQLYHQLALSDWSPFYKYKTYKQWHKVYGEPYTQYLGYGKKVDMWDRVKDDLVKAKTKHLFLTKTREELDFPHEPEDVIHWIELSEETKKVYNSIVKDKILTISPEIVIEYDTKAKLRYGLHMLEGGVAKYSYAALNSKNKPVVKSKYFNLLNTEKIDYIKEHWGDNDNVAIMYNYVGEGLKLPKHFKHAHILQATTNAEGIDLYHIKHLIIYSQDWSTARHAQRRARQANKFRDSDIKVHFLLVKKGVSAEVYNCVSINKVNYIDTYFEGTKL